MSGPTIGGSGDGKLQESNIPKPAKFIPNEKIPALLRKKMLNNS
jgi:hypothetical protein